MEGHGNSDSDPSQSKLISCFFDNLMDEYLPSSGVANTEVNCPVPGFAFSFLITYVCDGGDV